MGFASGRGASEGRRAGVSEADPRLKLAGLAFEVGVATVNDKFACRMFREACTQSAVSPCALEPRVSGSSSSTHMGAVVHAEC